MKNRLKAYDFNLIFSIIFSIGTFNCYRLDLGVHQFLEYTFKNENFYYWNWNFVQGICIRYTQLLLLYIVLGSKFLESKIKAMELVWNWSKNGISVKIWPIPDQFQLNLIHTVKGRWNLKKDSERAFQIDYS